MVFLFHSWYVMLGFCSKYEDFLFREDLFWFQSYWSRDILRGNFCLLFGNYIIFITDIVHKIDTSVSHIMLKGLFTNCYTWLISSCFGYAHYFRNTWFHSLWGVHDFTHSLYIHITEFVSFRTMSTDEWLWVVFAWISLTALSQTYFIHRFFVVLRIVHVIMCVFINYGLNKQLQKLFDEAPNRFRSIPKKLLCTKIR